MILEFDGVCPEINQTAYVASTAIAAGKVQLKKNASLLFSASARGDVNYIHIGNNSNIQDNATLHVTHSHPCIIGDNCVIGHNAVVHGATLEENVLVGIHATVLSGVKIGKNSIVAAGSLVAENQEIPENSMVMGSPAKVVRKTTDEEIKNITEIAARYVNIMQHYKAIDSNG